MKQNEDSYIITEIQRVSDSKIIRIGDEVLLFGFITKIEIAKDFAGGVKISIGEDMNISINIV